MLTSLLILLVFLSMSRVCCASQGALILRLDDVSDAPLYLEALETCLTVMLDKKAKMTLGVIAGYLNDERLLSLLRRGVKEGYFEIAIHGWNHENLTSLEHKTQVDLIANATRTLQSLIPEAKISSLVAPYNEVDVNVIRAATENGLKYVSGDLLHGKPSDIGEVRYRPVTVDTARGSSEWVNLDLDIVISRVRDSWRTYGYAMVVFHPQQFIRYTNGTAVGGVDKTRLRLIETLVDWAKTEADVILLDELPELNRSSADIPMAYGAILALAASLLLVLVKVRRRRTQAHT